ncbi:MAG: serine/threonine-protein kinase [Gemmatimonadaceae bacterium]
MKFCPTCGVEYADTERFCPQDGTPLRARDPRNDLVGTVIADRYHVLKKLGEGGMGQVYLAEHLRMRRKSAVKVMHPSMTSDADAIGRFNREASNACQIDHPNVAAIYDFGESSEGVVYLAMEFIEGRSLASLIKAHGALPAKRAAEITRQIADGLDAAHRLGIVHRDLKPDNILVGEHHDGRDKVKVVDFGISKAARAEGQTVTKSGQVIGTPDYMSPEQLSGDGVDHRSDIYSLAIVSFNMLTGQLPFQAHSAQSAMLLRLTDQPQRLSQTRPDIAWPIEMQIAFDRAMELEVARRFPTASAFAAALVDAASRVSHDVDVSARTLVSQTAPRPTDTARTGALTSSSPSVTPVDFSFPIPSGMSPAELAVLQSHLTKAVGPIAKVLVKRAAISSPTRQALIAALADEIDDERDRAVFTKAIS